jgi:predicted CoA-binding protein
MEPSTLEDARAFLRARRIALVGASRDAKDMSRAIMRELVRRGYDVVPVNPAVQEVDGRRAFARVSDVTPPAEAALVMTPPALAEAVVRDCAAAGVRELWFHRGAGAGAGTPEALALCARSGIHAVKDLCPFMALPGAGFGHRVHGFLRRRLARPAAAAR